MDYTELSKEMSYALRHAPWEYELEMDSQGFVPMGQLVAALDETGHYERPLTREDLLAAAEAPGKRRHEIVGDRIRALYGHSFPMRVTYEAAVPPAELFHGTARRFLPAITKDGLRPMSRQYVHLSADIDMARQVGSRHDRRDAPVVLRVDAAAAHEAGVRFYPTGNERVWLCDELPAAFLDVTSESGGRGQPSKGQSNIQPLTDSASPQNGCRIASWTDFWESAGLGIKIAALPAAALLSRVFCITQIRLDHAEASRPRRAVGWRVRSAE